MRRRVAMMKLSIDVDSEPISGSVSIGADGPQRFSGWIELVAAIEAARHEHREAAETLGWLPGAKPHGV